MVYMRSRWLKDVLKYINNIIGSNCLLRGQITMVYYLTPPSKIVITYVMHSNLGITHHLHQKYWHFLISPQKLRCRYSLEAPHWGASDEYPQHMFQKGASNVYPHHMFQGRIRKMVRRYSLLFVAILKGCFAITASEFVNISIFILPYFQWRSSKMCGEHI